MITRIEIDGFKSFHDFALDLLPFQVFIGPNGAGKSNLFDALTLLSALASGQTLYQAFSQIRGGVENLFSVSSDGSRAERMRFTVEMLIGKTIEFYGTGGEREVDATRLHYELWIERGTEIGLDIPYIRFERLSTVRTNKWVENNIPQQKRPNWIIPAEQIFFLFYHDLDQNTSLPIDVENDDKIVANWVEHLNKKISRTLLSGVDTILNSPTIFAARKELMGYQMLHLDPEKIRNGSTAGMYDPRSLLPDGSNLATVLFRLSRDEFTFTDIQRDLANLVPGITKLSIGNEKHLEISVTTQNGTEFKSRVLSDGTLRFLALVTLKNDPLYHGVLCVEEPENGVHPVRLKQIVELLHEMATDFKDDSEYADNTLRQVFINTHSPALIPYIPEECLYLVYMANIQAGASTVALPVKPLNANDQQRRFFTQDQIRRFLNPEPLEKSLEALGYNL